MSREKLCVEYFDLEDQIRILRKQQMAIKKELMDDEALEEEPQMGGNAKLQEFKPPKALKKKRANK